MVSIKNMVTLSLSNSRFYLALLTKKLSKTYDECLEYGMKNVLGKILISILK